MVRKNRLVLRPHVDRLDDRCLLSGLGSPSGYSPAQVTTAYGLAGLTFTTKSGQTVPADGTGETIAIVVAYHDPNLSSDLHVFDTAFGLPDPTLNQINLGGPTNTSDGWASEETLDVEWAHAIAPGATIDVIEAATDGTPNLIAAINTARNTPGVVAVTMSWGGTEISNEQSYDSMFTTPAGHTGITFIAATGDTGTQGGAEWPAASPNVLSVGGTSLTINTDGSYGGETAWSSSGSGLSAYEPEPSYQDKVQSSGKRAVPDVAFLADPNTGVPVYSTAPSTGSGGWQVVGGTSLGTPAWTGIVAIIDQGLALSGQGSLNGATQTIPELYSLLSTDFHTVADSTSAVSTGFVQTTVISTVGLGTPNGSTLITAMVHHTLPVPQPVTGNTTGSSGTTSSGSTGTTKSGTGSTQSGGTTTTTPVYTGGWWPIFGSGTTNAGTTGGTKTKATTSHGKTKTPVTKHTTPKPKAKPKVHEKATKPVKHAVTAHHKVGVAIAHSTGAGVVVASAIAISESGDVPTHDLTIPAAMENVPNIFDTFDRAIQEIANEMF